ncbi:MAG TPA: hypothetical protein VFP84_35850 [Kofleriaceae bacterium]|nr:hypothetical protein [Kofleriaceae bacterium]
MTRAGLVIGLIGLTVAGAPPGHADPLPSGSIGVLFGGGAGTGKSRNTLGIGYYQFGGQAAWQPMNTDQHIGWSFKWQFVFGTMYESDSARVDDFLRTLQMDFLAGIRFRPWASPTRYLALRGGVELLRSNELIDGQRAYVGAVAMGSFEQYAFGKLLLDVDLRYGLIGSGPAELALLVGASLAIP